MTTEILATKLFIPPVQQALVVRPRLTERLSLGLACKLILLTAPAGFGKTTAVRAWLDPQAEAGVTYPFIRRPAQAAWVSLDAGDNDPTRFWRYVITALDPLAPGLAEALLQQLQVPQPPIDVILTRALNLLAVRTTDAVLVLDDYHVITAPDIHAGIIFLLDHLSPHLHLVITSRSEPSLPLARLRVRGQLTELRAADLRFTSDEAAHFLLDTMGLSLASDAVEALEARTEGWVAGLQLAALAMRDRRDVAGFLKAFTGSNRLVMDYMVEEVFVRQPPHVQQFLLQTSILDRMCGALCDAVLGLTLDDGQSHAQAPSSIGQAYSQLLLDDLEQRQLFLIALDDERQWYRYHPLFSEVLRDRLLKGVTTEAVAQLHQRASWWYERSGLFTEAVQHALAAHDDARTATLIEQQAPAFFARGEAMVVQQWVRQLPAGLMRTRPSLALQVCWMHMFLSRADQAEHILRDAAVLDAPSLSDAERGSALVLYSTLARGRDDHDQAIAFAHRAVALLPETNYGMRGAAQINIGIALLHQGQVDQAVEALEAAVRLGFEGNNLYLALAAVDELATLHIRRSALARAFQVCERAIAAVQDAAMANIPPAGLPAVCLGEVLYEWNECERAATAFTRGIELLRGATERGALLRGFLGLARCQWALDQPALATMTLTECHEWFAHMGLGDDPYLLAHLASTWARLGQLEQVERWSPRVPLPPSDMLVGMQSCTQVRTLLLRYQQSNEKNATELLDTIEQLLAPRLAYGARQGWIHEQIELLVLQATAYHVARRSQHARASLTQALTLGMPSGYVRSFRDAGPPMAVLLQELSHAPLGRDERAYVGQLLRTFDGTAVPVPASDQLAGANDHALIEALNERERDVLRLIAAGHSNREIADKLVIALSTVKTHINNCYGKLGVHTRTQAIARARELGLI